MNLFLTPHLVCVPFFCALSIPANAGFVIQATSVTTNMGEWSNLFPKEAMISQKGLITPYVSGVTDFDSYIASNPQHQQDTSSNFDGTWSRWVSSHNITTGFVDFNLGGSSTIESVVMWQFGGSIGNNIQTFNLLVDADGDFSSGATTLLSNQFADISLGREVFEFAATEAQFVRLEITSNAGGPNTQLREIAFEGSASQAVPEPASLAMWSMMGGIGLLVRRRERRQAA
ncbi:MAG: hypothetical protein RIK87_29210 [Fuerstiella sp.]